MVAALLLVVVLAVVQLAFALWVRTALIDAAGEGARLAALDGADLAAGSQRAREIAAMSLGSGYLEAAAARREARAGYDVIVVELTAPLPVLGLLGPGGSLTVTGSAVAER